MTVEVKCPTCSKTVVWGEQSPFRPFCCERCRLIDLGEWANEEKVIKGRPVQEDEGKSDNWE
ncbi:DNA gyrase inhibitor YacG [Alginatibacterium sediminis]|uniref:DNA gyrase inhibitor YacG n=1 Tax=Alginatibacterium sediminis TaxID=2164068 RepID=A0A420EJN2_9ALTE|nr:DNA gyrase inhibitor YacG [Alginatibacterium sediminis]RKF20860.1 DNA gyrase inhibitor YacG [Alginatibacterium sediminis]